MDEWLPDITIKETGLQSGFYPTGTWEKCQENGVKAKDIGVGWQ